MSNYKEIPIYNKTGIVCYSKIDEEDFEKVNKVRWHLVNGYVTSKYGRLHRFVISAKKGDPLVDHLNYEKLDNRKSNLRFASKSQNAQNKPKKENCSSKFIGVYKGNKGSWRCTIRIDKRKSFTFEKEEHAAYWYDCLAIEHYGPEANINKIEKPVNFTEPNKKTKLLPKGVTLLPSGKYRVVLYKKHIGVFKTIDEANKKYIKAKEEQKEKRIEKKIGSEIERNKENIAIIKTSKGKEILVDDDKYFELKKYTWNINKGYFYAEINGKGVLMHRYLINPAEDEIVDHINHNRGDNRLVNLRICSESLNSHNRTKILNTSSTYYGIHFENYTKKYRAEIKHLGVRYRLGRFKTEIEAAKAYNKKAIELYGDNANLNNIV